MLKPHIAKIPVASKDRYYVWDSLDAYKRGDPYILCGSLDWLKAWWVWCIYSA